MYPLELHTPQASDALRILTNTDNIIAQCSFFPVCSAPNFDQRNSAQREYECYANKCTTKTHSGRSTGNNKCSGNDASSSSGSGDECSGSSSGSSGR